jgi:hypothetical protein
MHIHAFLVALEAARLVAIWAGDVKRDVPGTKLALAAVPDR